MLKIGADLFQQIKSDTNGYLKWEIYQEIFRSAQLAPEGAVIDIGPAQGGSTICLALGRKYSVHEAKVFSLDVFSKSSALMYWDNAEKNLQVIRDNLEKYDVLESVSILQIGEIAPKSIIKDTPAAVMFIDADGALDRDFKLFYQQLKPNAAIILDDVEDKFNRRVDKYLRYSEEEEQKYVHSKGAQSFRDLTPLGKEYTTWKFTQKLIELGFIEPIHQIRKTLFARKPAVEGINDRFDRESHFLDEVRDSIYSEFLEKKRAFLNQ